MKLLEKSRSDLLNKSVGAKKTKSYGTTRYARRKVQHIENSAQPFNDIDMNSLFKGDLLLLNVPVKGETDNYNVSVVFKGVCDDIRKEIRANKWKFEYKCIYKAIIKAINRQDIYLGCSCNDWKFRFSYIATKEKFNAGSVQLVPANVTNPNNDLGAGCKHSLKVLADLEWVIKLSTAITNYVLYAEAHFNDKYKSLIFPAVYGFSYEEAVKKGILDTEEADDRANQEDIRDSSEDLVDSESGVIESEEQE